MTLIPHHDEDEPYVMSAKRDGICHECKTDLCFGDDIIWDPKNFKAYCMECGSDLLP